MHQHLVMLTISQPASSRLSTLYMGELASIFVLLSGLHFRRNDYNTQR